MAYLIYQRKQGLGTALEWSAALTAPVNWVISNGGLTALNDTTGQPTSTIVGSKPIPAGKWFWEIDLTAGGNRWAGIVSSDNLPSIIGANVGDITYSAGFRPDGRLHYISTLSPVKSGVASAYGPILMSYDTAVGEIKFYFNNSLRHTVTDMPIGGDQMYVGGSISSAETLTLTLDPNSMSNSSRVSTLQGQGFVALS